MLPVCDDVRDEVPVFDILAVKLCVIVAEPLLELLPDTVAEGEPVTTAVMVPVREPEGETVAAAVALLV